MTAVVKKIDVNGEQVYGGKTQLRQNLGTTRNSINIARLHAAVVDRHYDIVCNISGACWRR